MGDKIPTAEELWNKLYLMKGGATWTKDPKAVAIEVAKAFSKLHVEAALKAAAEKLPEFRATAYTEIILSAYPLTNIK